MKEIAMRNCELHERSYPLIYCVNFCNFYQYHFYKNSYLKIHKGAHTGWYFVIVYHCFIFNVWSHTNLSDYNKYLSALKIDRISFTYFYSFVSIYDLQPMASEYMCMIKLSENKL